MSTGFGRKGLGSLEGGADQPASRGPAFAQTAPVVPQKSSPSSSVAKFNITPSPGKFVLGILLFGASTPIILNEMLDPRGVVINGIIELGPFGADVFFGILLCVALGLVAISCMGLISAFSSKRWVKVDFNAITAPASPVSQKTNRLAFAEIVGLSMTENQGHEWVTISDRKGQNIKLVVGDFESENHFAEFLNLVEERMNR